MFENYYKSVNDTVLGCGDYNRPAVLCLVSALAQKYD